MTRRHKLFSLTLALLMLPSAIADSAEPDQERWVAYYGDQLEPQAFEPYSLVVFDADRHPPLTSLKNDKRILLAYISYGESADYRFYAKTLADKGMLLNTPVHWPGNKAIDVRNPAWTAMIIEQLIPHILWEGFDGIMIDTVDTSLHLEEQNPDAFAGMRDSAVRTIRAIRAHYPNLRIMLNRGFGILEEVAGELDMALAESILVDFNAADNQAQLFPQEIYASLMQQLTKIRDTHPDLKIYTLDYWPDGNHNDDDHNTVKQIYLAQRSNGFIPYVAKPNLLSVTVEPQ